MKYVHGHSPGGGTPPATGSGRGGGTPTHPLYALCYVLIDKCEVAPETFLAGLGLDLARSLAEDHCGGKPTLGRPVIDLSLSPTVVVKTEEPEGNKKRRVSRYDEWENSSQGLYSHQPTVLD